MIENSANWDTLDWSALDRLRDLFLAGKSSGASYWTSRSDLANYDFTFAQRIAWKWDAVLRELKLRGWAPPPGSMLDWGCGSGIAGRRVIEFFGEKTFDCLRVLDRSMLAMEFAADAARKVFPSLRVVAAGIDGIPQMVGRDVPIAPRRAETVRPTHNESIGTLIISHVLNELEEPGGRALRKMIDRADAVLWVEPGTYADSRSLIELREALRETFHVIAPCTHQCGCGLRTPE
ncbi:MAG TPA: small ribosomal subunit Rsm22 family protein, partial [Verrucomicrobiae bacterium]|nr:small ribosomal subunit Rsm22 family protein [Verrucomicrobiae bacterium]